MNKLSQIDGRQKTHTKTERKKEKTKTRATPAEQTHIGFFSLFDSIGRRAEAVKGECGAFTHSLPQSFPVFVAFVVEFCCRRRRHGCNEIRTFSIRS